MIDALKPVTTAPTLCKICGGAAPLYGVVDFNKSCEEANGLKLSLAGVPVYYRRCANCHFVFTDAFDDWGADQFKTHIYNDDYRMVDPDYKTTRPRGNPPTPRARSSERHPVGITLTGTSTSRLPRRMIEPLP